LYPDRSVFEALFAAGPGAIHEPGAIGGKWMPTGCSARIVNATGTEHAIGRNTARLLGLADARENTTSAPTKMNSQIPMAAIGVLELRKRLMGEPGKVDGALQCFPSLNGCRTKFLVPRVVDNAGYRW
jgi:hypothetical protein